MATLGQLWDWNMEMHWTQVLCSSGRDGKRASPWVVINVINSYSSTLINQSLNINELMLISV